MQKMFVGLTSFLLILLIEQGDFTRTASVVLYQNGNTTIFGTLNIYQSNSSSPVVINGSINHLNINSSHGFHVHTSPVSDSSPDCLAAGDHFNPYNVSHGPPTASVTNRHVGDLGNVTTDINGTAIVSITDSIIDLYNITRSIINRTLIVHATFDDGNSSSSTGNAGGRLACGTIKFASDSDLTTTTTITMNTTAAATTTSNSAHQLSPINISFLLSSIFFIFSF